MLRLAPTFVVSDAGVDDRTIQRDLASDNARCVPGSVRSMPVNSCTWGLFSQNRQLS